MRELRDFFLFDLVGRRIIGAVKGATIEGVVTSVVIEGDRIEVYTDKRPRPAVKFRHGSDSTSLLPSMGSPKVYIPSVDTAFTVVDVTAKA